MEPCVVNLLNTHGGVIGAIFSVNVLPTVKSTNIFSTISHEQFVIIQAQTPSSSMASSLEPLILLHCSAFLFSFSLFTNSPLKFEVKKCFNWD